MTYYNLNGITINLEKFVSALVEWKPKQKGFVIIVTVRSSKNDKKIKRITSPPYDYASNANSDLSKMVIEINKLKK